MRRDATIGLHYSFERKEEVKSTPSSLFNILEFLKGKNLQQARYSIIYALAQELTSTNLVSEYKKFSNLIDVGLGRNNNDREIYLFKLTEDAINHVEAASDSASKLFSDDEDQVMDVIDSYLSVLLTRQITLSKRTLEKGVASSLVSFINNKHIIESTYLEEIVNQRNFGMVTSHFREMFNPPQLSYSPVEFKIDSITNEFIFYLLISSDKLLVDTLTGLHYGVSRLDVLNEITSLTVQERRYLSLALLELFCSRSINDFSSNTKLINELELNTSKRLDFKLPFRSVIHQHNTQFFLNFKSYLAHNNTPMCEEVIRFILMEISRVKNSLNIFPILNNNLYLSEVPVTLNLLTKCWRTIFDTYDHDYDSDFLQFVPVLYMEYMRVSNAVMHHPEIVVDNELLYALKDLERTVSARQDSTRLPDFKESNISVDSASKELMIEIFKDISSPQFIGNVVISSLKSKYLKSHDVIEQEDIDAALKLITILNRYNLLR